MASLSLGDMATAIRSRQEEIVKERAKANPDKIAVRECGKKMEDLAKDLKEETNFATYPIEKLICLTDYPTESIAFDFQTMFGKMDAATGKYKITILSSVEAAILW